MSKKDNKVLKTYLKGTCSKSEYSQVMRIFENDQSDDLENFMKEHWSKEEDNQPLNMQMINLLLKMKEKTKKMNPVRSLFVSFQRIAAILIIPLLVITLWTFLKPVPEIEVAKATIVSPLGGQVEFSLPDGTKGWLNNGSTLSYNTDFKERKVELKGEAYFEVTRRNSENFIVQTHDLSVEVLGTKFNVSAYDDDLIISVILNEGKVKVFNDEGTISETLNPNEKFDFVKAELQASITNVNSTDYTLWKDGYLKFRGEVFSDVIKRMERWYNVEIKVNDQQLNNYKYRGTFQNEQLEEVLRLISLTTPLTYIINEREINEQGTYKKREVIIKSK